MKLPSVYANKIDKTINNNVEVFRNNGTSNYVNKDLFELKECFDSSGYANKLNVLIETKEGKSLERLVLCLKDCFVNIYNKKIYFKDIVNYEIKK
jgi:hypothetical protein